MKYLVTICNVDQNWKHAKTVKFCFQFALQVSNNSQGGINRIKRDENSLLTRILHPSDIAYVITHVVSNKEMWTTKWMVENMKKKPKNRHRRTRRNMQGQAKEE